MRLCSALIALSIVVALTGCAVTAPDLPSGPIAAQVSLTESFYGTWNFVAETPENVLQGLLVLTDDPAEHRIEMPGSGVAPEVIESAFSAEGDRLLWTGILVTPLGPTAFRISGTFDGEAIRGTNEIDGLGTYPFVATRADGSPAR